MLKLEELQPNASARGILPDSLVTVVNVQWFGAEALEPTYKDPAARVANELLYRHDESRLEIVEHGRPWSFDGDGHLNGVDATAMYPPLSAWGTDGWTFGTLREAETRFSTLARMPAKVSV